MADSRDDILSSLFKSFALAEESSSSKVSLLFLLSRVALKNEIKSKQILFYFSSFSS